MEHDLIVFDFDGVILDSGLDDFRWYTRVRMKKAEELGYSLSSEEAMKVVSCRDYSCLKEFMDSKGMDRDDLLTIEKQVQETKKKMVEEGVIRLFPGTRKALEEIEVEKALATNAPAESSGPILEEFGLEDYFSRVEMEKVGNLERFMERKKPSPDMLESIVEDIDPSNPLMVGDSPNDIRAAENAGMDSCFIKSHRDGSRVDPDYEARNIGEFKSRFTG